MSCDNCPKKNGCKSHLALVEQKEAPKAIPEKPSSNFWNSCPEKYEYIPDREPCEKGRTEECDWWINSAEHNYCFWRFIQKNSDPDGNMRPMMQSQIARHFNWSATKVHFIIKEALQKLKDSGQLELLAALSPNIIDPLDDEDC